MLRNVFVILLAAFGTAAAFTGGFNGLLYYLWVAHFRPEAWVWNDFVQNLNLSMVAGAITLAGALLGRERFHFNGRVILLLVFGLQNLISTSLSPYYADSWPPFIDFAKSLVIVYLIFTMSSDLTRLRQVFAVIALSLGFEGAKQGWASLVLSPGARNLNAVAHLGDNNAVAVGMLIVVAMMIALAGTATRRWERHMYQFLAVGVLYRAISTYSRGGLLACIAMVAWYIIRSKHKTITLAGIAIVGCLLLPALPTEFWDRMNTINEAREDVDSADGSIRGRLHFWQVAVVMAEQNPMFGIGNFAFNAAYDRYDFTGGTFGHQRSVHSSWFGTLAELGYPGLIVFVTIVLMAFASCFRARAAVARGAPQEFQAYALALEMSLIAFAVGGSFVVLQYNELLWHVIGLTMALHALAVAAPVAAASRSTATAEPQFAMAVTPPWSHA